jgi:hypothetical protein
MNKESSNNPSVSGKTEKGKTTNKEVPEIKFIGELDELTRSDLNSLISDPKYSSIFKSLNLVNNVPIKKENK